MILKRLAMFVLVLQMFTLASCDRAANDSKEASEKLTTSSKWLIDEIIVNDALTFQNGKMIQQFGGIDFERYMETVQFKANGDFEGYFKGDSKPMLLHWKLNEKDISIIAADGKSGAWTVVPGDVKSNSFVMKTQSTAYDYPRMTKIELKFKRE